MSIKNGIVYGNEVPWIPSHLSYSIFLKDILLKGGDKVALVAAQTGEQINYKEILTKSTNLAISLQTLGLKKGEVVCVCSENRFEYMITVIGALFAGAIVSTANMLYTEDELRHVLNISKPKYVFCSPTALRLHSQNFKKFDYIQQLFAFGSEKLPTDVIEFEKLIENQGISVEDFEPVEAKGAEDVAVILYSSGTTGLPKGVMLTHVNMLAGDISFVQSDLDVTKSADLNNILSLVPWFHAYGFLSTLFLMSANRLVIYLPRFQDREYVSTIEKYKIELILAVPPIVVFLAKSPIVDEYDVTSVREIWSGAAPLSEEVIRATMKRFKNIRSITQAYGMTETTLAVLRDQDRVAGSKPGSVGRPKPGIKVKVVDLESRKILGPYEEGEICIKGAVLMKGYIGEEASTANCCDSDGYLLSGDVGYYDKDGCFYIVDRVKDLIKYKGFQVAPAELEAVLLQHPGVLDCGVAGKPDETAGELPTAFVAKRPGVKVSEKDIMDFIASKLSKTKHLHGGVVFLKEIPKNPSGKILRKELKKLLKKSVPSKL